MRSVAAADVADAATAAAGSATAATDTGDAATAAARPATASGAAGDAAAATARSTTTGRAAGDAATRPATTAGATGIWGCGRRDAGRSSGRGGGRCGAAGRFIAAAAANRQNEHGRTAENRNRRSSFRSHQTPHSRDSAANLFPPYPPGRLANRTERDGGTIRIGADMPMAHLGLEMGHR